MAQEVKPVWQKLAPTNRACLAGKAILHSKAKPNTAYGSWLGMDVHKQSAWQKLAHGKWPGYTIEGDGQWACVDSLQLSVRLFDQPQDARIFRMGAPWARAIYRLEEIVPPRVWERD